MAENRELALVLRLVADEFQKELKNSQGALSSFNTFVKDWRAQLAAAGTALFAIAKTTANYGDELFKTSQKVGIQVQALAGLQYAAKLADVDNRQLQVGLQALSRAMVDSAQGTGEGHEAFKRIGVSAVDASGKLKPMQDVLLEIADVFSKSADGAGKTEVAMKLMGKSGADLIPLLKGGKQSLQEMDAEARRLGLTMSESDARAAEAFNDAIGRLEAQARGFSNTIGVHMLRPLTELMSLMNDLGGGPIAEALQFVLKGLNELIVIMGSNIRVLGASFDYLRGKLNFDEVRTYLRLIDAQTSAKLLLLENPEAQKFLDDPKKKTTGRDVVLGIDKPQIPTGGGKTTTDHAKEQERLGLALLDIYRSQHNALEIKKNHIREELQLMFRQEEIADDELRTREATQGELGRQIVAETQQQVRAREAAQGHERDGLVKNLQAWIDYDNQVGASTELRLEHQLDLVRANLAQQLQITTEEAGKLLAAWENVESAKADAILNQTMLTAQERETIELQSLTRLAAVHQQHSGNIFEGWARGLQRYVQDTQSGFGLGADLARRTAQVMEQNFRTFFFDAFEGKIRSLKDVFQSFGNFVKQIMAQVAAQLATKLVLQGVTGGFGSFGLGGLFSSGGLLGGGGFGAAKFASGGPVLGSGNQDSVRAMLTPGEGVLNRKGMQALAQLNSGTAASSSSPNVTVNFHGLRADERPQVNYRRQFEGLVVDVILRNRDLHAALGWAR